MNNGETPLPLAVVGCDFRRASSRWRSLLVLQEDEALRIAAELAASDAADGFAELATCNRNEWIVSTEKASWSAELLRAWMLRKLGSAPDRRIEPYVFVGEDAATHLFRVVLGRESLVVGERQIAGQFFRALQQARERRTSSRVLNGLSAAAGRLVRSATRSGLLTSTAKGVHNLAFAYLRSKLPEPHRARVVVVGLGEIGRRVRGLLEADPRFVAVACNRTVKDGETGHVRPLSELPLLLGEADAAIVCTGAAEPLVRPEHLSSRGGDRPLLLIDLGIPEQIVRNGLPENVKVSGLDELTAAGGGDGRGDCRENDTDELVLNAVLELRRYCNEYNLREMLAGVQRRHRRLIREELPRFVDERFSDLPHEVRARLVQDIHGMLSSYTHELMGTVKKAARPFDEVP
jgi:glutamyl-tRNA reductase